MKRHRSGDSWRLGTRDNQPFTFPSAAMLRHAVVFGASGSGKTVACKVLLEEALLSGVPVIAVDPQGDLASMALDPPAGVEVVVWTPGHTAGRALRLNPFGREAPSEPSERVAYLGRLAANVAGLVGANEERESIIEIALTAAAEQRIPLKSLSDLADLLQNPTDGLSEQLDKITKSRVVGDLARTLHRYSFGAKGQLLETGEALSVDEMLGRTSGDGKRTRLSVVYLNCLVDQGAKAAFLGFLLDEVYAWMLQNPSPDGSLHALLFLDELAPFVPPSNQKKPPCKDSFLILIRQARKYGLGMLLASQNIGDLDYQALNQCSSWFLGGCRATQELNKAKEALGSRSAEAASSASQLPGLGKGEFLCVSKEALGHARPTRINIRNYTRQHRPLDLDALKALPAVSVGAGERRAPTGGPAPRPPAAPPRTSPPARHAPPVRRPSPLGAPRDRPPRESAPPSPSSSAAPVNRETGLSPAASSSAPRPQREASPVNAPSPRPSASGADQSEVLRSKVTLRTGQIPVSPHGIQVDGVLELNFLERAGSENEPGRTLVFLLDRSGSMSVERKLETAKAAIESAASLLGPRDRFCLISFSSAAMVEVGLGPVDSATLRSRLGAISAGGGTNISQALQQAIKELQRCEIEGAAQVFLLTDGRTFDDEDVCHRHAAELRSRGIPLVGYGLGTDWNESFLQELTNDRYEFVARSEEIPKYFEAATQRLRGLVARELRCSIVTSQGVTLLPVTLERSFGGIAEERVCETLGPGPEFVIPDVSSAEGALYLLLSFELEAHQSGPLELAEVCFEGRTLAGDAFRASTRVTVEVTDDRNAVVAAEPLVVETLKRIHTKRMLQNSHADLQSGDSERVARGTRRLRGATKKLEDMGQTKLAAVTRRIVDSIDNGASGDSAEMKEFRQITKRV